MVLPNTPFEPKSAHGRMEKVFQTKITSSLAESHRTERTEHTSTPVAVRIASIRHVDDVIPWSVTSLNAILDLELDGAILTNQEFLETVFPDARLPFSIDQELLDRLPNVYSHSSWTQLPDYTEADHAAWLNSIGYDLEVVTGSPMEREWNADFCNTPLPGSVTKRKPDIILLNRGSDQNNDTPREWSAVRGICEVTSEESFPARIRHTIRQKSFVTFATQPDRRFVLSLSFSRDKFRFTACDRAGLITSSTYDVDLDALVLLRILAGFMFSSSEVIGYDPSMHRGPQNDIKAITVQGMEYTVIEKIFSSETVRGCATQCWRVRRDGVEYVIKDSWCVRERESEITTLETLKGMEGVPQLFASEDLMSFGNVDSTAARRVGIDKQEERIHRRLVIGPVAQPLSTFSSKKELIQAFIDVIQTHKTLCEEKSILHRDISTNNIMLYHPTSLALQSESKSKHRRGLLIDFDYSARIGGNQTPSDTHRTGTGPYMAIEVLLKADTASIVQKANHDLESIFYVLLCFCYRYQGPCGMRHIHPKKSPVDKWFVTSQSYEDLAVWKSGQFINFEEFFIEKIPPYFEDLKPCLRKLFDVVFPPLSFSNGRSYRETASNGATHDSMLEVLQEMLNGLPDVERPPPQPTRKRRAPLQIPDRPDNSGSTASGSSGRGRSDSSIRGRGRGRSGQVGGINNPRRSGGSNVNQVASQRDSSVSDAGISMGRPSIVNLRRSGGSTVNQVASQHDSCSSDSGISMGGSSGNRSASTSSNKRRRY